MVNTNQHQAFLSEYQEIHASFVRYCSSRAYGKMETEDLVQEAILATLQAFDRLRDKKKLRSFMIGIVNNIVKNYLRQKKFHADWEEKSLEKMESQLGDPELALDIHFLYRSIDQLSDQQKEALLLFEISGFSIREIAEIQETSPGAVKTKLSRARKTLKEMWSDHPENAKQIPLSKRLAIFASLF